MKLYAPLGHFRTSKVLVTASLCGLEVQLIVPDKAFLKSKEFVAKSPLKKLPVLESAGGALTESDAIIRYLARTSNSALYQGSLEELSEIDTWLDINKCDLELALAAWVYPVLGQEEFNEQVYEASVTEVKTALFALETRLKTRRFIVGERLTLADVAWATTLSIGYKLVFSEKFRKPFVNVNKWISSILEIAEFIKVLGRSRWCVEEAKTSVESEEGKVAQKKEKKKEKKNKEEKKAKEEEIKGPASEPKKEKKEKKSTVTGEETKSKEAEPKKEKKEKKVKKEKPKAVPKPASPPPEEDEDEAPRSHNPLDQLPPTSFVLDLWKRLYANTKNKREVISQFWTQYENEGWSLWLLQYQKAEGEGEELFKTNNLLEGFISRMDHFRRYSFGTMGVYGEEPALEIKGALLWRGQPVPAELLDHPSFEYYTRTRVDPGNEEQRRLVEDYWCNNQESDRVEGLRLQNWRPFL